MTKIFLISLMLITTSFAYSQSFDYTYDNNGNRNHRELVEMKSMENADTATIEQLVSQLGEMSVSVFPNPLTEVLHVDIENLPLEEQGRLSVLNTQGIELRSIENVAAFNSIDLSLLAQGNYLLVLQVGDLRKEWTLVKQ